MRQLAKSNLLGKLYKYTPLLYCNVYELIVRSLFFVCQVCSHTRKFTWYVARWYRYTWHVQCIHKTRSVEEKLLINRSNGQQEHRVNSMLGSRHSVWLRVFTVSQGFEKPCVLQNFESTDLVTRWTVMETLWHLLYADWQGMCYIISVKCWLTLCFSLVWCQD